MPSLTESHPSIDIHRDVRRISEADWPRLKPQLRRAAYEVAIVASRDRSPAGLDELAGYTYRDLLVRLIRTNFTVVSVPDCHSDQAFLWSRVHDRWRPNWKLIYATAMGWSDRRTKPLDLPPGTSYVDSNNKR
jgi:hypothetical protein